MEPNNNIDQQFREKLAAREITPSANSWDRLDAMLTVAEKPKKSNGWVYYAAACLGFLLIATVFFRNSDEMIDKGSERVVFEMPVSSSGAPDISSEKDADAAGAGIATAASTVKLQNRAGRSNNTAYGAAGIHIHNQEIDPNPTSPDQAVQSNAIINQKTEQPLTVRKPAYINVDELLASVEGTAKTPVALTGKSGIRVNPGDLLSQVDGELESSFRDKVIKGVNKNFQAVKVALANRNHE